MKGKNCKKVTIIIPFFLNSPKPKDIQIIVIYDKSNK